MKDSVAIPESPLDRWDGLNAAEATLAWQVPRVEFWRSIGSTNDRARDLLASGAGAWTLVLAEEQVRGRGRRGRGWSSPPGMGIYLSVILPGGGGDGPPALPLAVGLAVARALDRSLGARPPWGDPGRVRVKWPNDLLLEGRKVAGILCERFPRGVVAGIGVNVGQGAGDFPPEVRERAVSLTMATGAPVSRRALVEGFLLELRRVLGPGPQGGWGDGTLEALRSRDALRGRRVRVGVEGAVPGRGVVEGEAAGLDGEGRLLIRGSGGQEIPVSAGTVEILDSFAGGS